MINLYEVSVFQASGHFLLDNTNKKNQDKNQCSVIKYTLI